MKKQIKRRPFKKSVTSSKPSIPYTVYLHQIRSGKIEPVYILFGADHPGKNELVSELQNADKFNVEVFQMLESEAIKKEKVSAFLSKVFAQSLWGDKILLIVKDFQNLSSAQQKEILDRIVNVPKNYFVTIVIDSKFRSDTLALLNQYNFAMANFYAPDQRIITQYVSDLAKNLGLVIDSEAAKILLDLVGNDFVIISQELEKIKTFLGDKTRITSDIVFTACGFSKESSIEDLTSAAFQRNRTRSIGSLYRLQKDREVPVVIVSWLTNTGFQILQIKLGANQKSLEVGKKRFETLLNQSQTWSAKELSSFLLELGKIDRKIKTGYPEPFVLLESLLLKTGKNNNYEDYY